MPGPGAAAGAKAASAAAGRFSAGAASRSGSAKAAKQAGTTAAGRSAGSGGGGNRGGKPKSLGRLTSIRLRRERDGENDQALFGSAAFKAIAIGGGVLTFFVLVIVAPLSLFEASAANCGGEEDEAVPIQTNHHSDPENLSQTQIEIRIYMVGQVMHMTPRQIVTAFDVAFVESTMANLYGGDRDSVGVFQQRNFSPWTDGERNRINVIDASISFFLQLRKLDHGQSIPVLAQDVQVSGYPERYFAWVDEAVAVYNRIHRLIGTAAGVKSIKGLQGVSIGGGGLDSLSLGAACSGVTATGPANVKQAVTVYRPRSFKALPANLWAGGGSPEAVDTRIWPDAVWVLSTYHLRARAARETGHETHGDGTAMDMVPANGDSQQDWDSSALALARALGWTSGCGSNGLTKSAGGLCNLVPAIRFIGYNGYPNHGDPAHCSRAKECPPHIHVSWESNCYGCYPQTLGPAAKWVKVFPVGPEAAAASGAKNGGKGGRKA